MTDLFPPSTSGGSHAAHRGDKPSNILIQLVLAGLSLSGCWADRGSCEFWAAKLRAGQEVTVAVKQLADDTCVTQRPLLLEHLGDPALGSDVLAALVALGRSPEAEQAIVASLARPETVAAAAPFAAAWKLAAAEAPIRAALADDALAGHRAELLAAAVAVAPAERWMDEIARHLGAVHGDAATTQTAFDLLAKVEWAAVPESARGPVVEVLADLLSRPPGAVPAERLQAAAAELARVPKVGALPALTDVVARAQEGNRAAFLILWCLGHPATGETALTLASKEGLDSSVSAVALAYLASAPGGPPEDLPARVAAAPGDIAVLEGLALLGGPAVVPALEARVDSDKGAVRTAASRALALALPTSGLDAWEAALRRQASILSRGIPSDPRVAAETSLTRSCQDAPGCYLGKVDESLAALDTLDADLTAARAAVKVADDQARAAVAADAARAQELARGPEGQDEPRTPAALEAARSELDAIQKRRDTAYAAVATATQHADEVDAKALTVTISLRRAMWATSDEDRARLKTLALAVLNRCRGGACAGPRAWAAAALRVPGGGPLDVAGAVAANSDDTALACLLASMNSVTP